MPPPATFCHRTVDLAVGLAAYSRKVDGFTPSVATYPPLTRTRAASSRFAASTPGSLRMAAIVPVGSVVGATTSRSADRSLRSGRTGGAGDLGAKPTATTAEADELPRPGNRTPACWAAATSVWPAASRAAVAAATALPFVTVDVAPMPANNEA